MRNDHEDAPAMVPVELSTERPDTLPPDTEPSGPPGQAAVMAQTLAELLSAVMAMPGILRQDMANGREADRAHLKQELTALHVLMSADIDAARDEVIDKTNAHFVALDRKLDQAISQLAGSFDVLAETATSALAAGTEAHEKTVVLDQRIYELEAGAARDAQNDSEGVAAGRSYRPTGRR